MLEGLPKIILPGYHSTISMFQKVFSHTGSVGYVHIYINAHNLRIFFMRGRGQRLINMLCLGTFFGFFAEVF